MKSILFVLIVILSITACRDIAVGFLEVDEASYSIDSLVLFDQADSLRKMEVLWDRFQEAAVDLRQESSVLEEKTNAAKGKLNDFDEKTYNPLLAKLKTLSPGTPEYIACEQELEAAKILRDVKKEEWEEANLEWWNKKQEVKELAARSGIGEEKVFKQQMATLKGAIDRGNPWVTLPISGVLGTEPMIYSIENVYNEDSAAAELFGKSLSIIGGGKMLLKTDNKAPAGKYRISIRVENEGHSAVLKDIFVFIVE